MPSPSQVHIDSALSSFASAYTNGDLIADIASPIIEVDKRSDAYFQYSRADASTIRDDVVGPDSQANQSDYTLTNTTYSVIDRALKQHVSMETIANADAPLDPLMDATDNLMLRLSLGRELRVATQVTTAANYATSAAVANVWTDKTNGTPVDDLLSAIAGIAPGSPGSTRLVACMSQETWNALSTHPDTRGGGALRSVSSRPEVASLVGLDEIYVSTAMRNTAAAGLAPVYARIFDAVATGRVAVLRVPNGRPRGKQAMFGATFRFRPTGMAPVQVRRWEVPELGPRGAEAIQVSMSDAESLVQNDMGYLLTGCI